LADIENELCQFELSLIRCHQLLPLPFKLRNSPKELNLAHLNEHVLNFGANLNATHSGYGQNITLALSFEPPL
jgi:hypothetical protein